MATAAGGVFGLCVLNHSASFFSPLYFPSFQDKACLLDFGWLCRWPASGGLGCLNALVLACVGLQNESDGTEGCCCCGAGPGLCSAPRAALTPLQAACGPWRLVPVLPCLLHSGSSCNFLNIFLFEMPGWCSRTAYQIGEMSQAKTNSWWCGFNQIGSPAQLPGWKLICLNWCEWGGSAGVGTSGWGLRKPAGRVELQVQG